MRQTHIQLRRIFIGLEKKLLKIFWIKILLITIKKDTIFEKKEINMRLTCFRINIEKEL